MSWLRRLSPRVTVLFLLWTLPVIVYMVLGAMAIYQTGWFYRVFWILPLMWLAAWLVGYWWKPAKHHHSVHGKPIKAPTFWTPQDTAAIAIVEAFRAEVDDVDGHSLTDFTRYLADAQQLAQRLASHYHAEQGDKLLHPLTLVEILSVIHLAVEDLEQWTLDHVPGSTIATVGQIEQVPGIMNALDVAQKVFFVASAIVNPSKLLAYPLWRKSSRVTVELQKELVRRFYQRYLRQLGYYLIEMYSGRLRGGSLHYRSQFASMATMSHQSRGDMATIEKLEEVSTTIAVMGQVKAGKSSLINALMGDQVATASILPQTREVQRFDYTLPGSKNQLTLLDTPGYHEADVSESQLREIRTATQAANVILLVMAANVPARESDRQLLNDIENFYTKQKHLRPPPIIAVLTHVDLLRPVREWSPPYDWRNPHSLKEESMAAAVQYLKEIFGSKISGYACVYTGDEHQWPSSVADEVVPQLIDHLNSGHSAAILKAFYQRLSEQRWQKLSQQVIQLVKAVVRG